MSENKEKYFDKVLPGEPRSMWNASVPVTHFPPLTENIFVDTAVLGGGIAGLTTAFLLKAAGQTVAVIEAGRIASLVSGHTTAKITSAHGVIYSEITRKFNKEAAQLYGEANEAAIEQVAQMIKKMAIFCEFERTRAYTFAEKEENREQIKAEVEASKNAGLPAFYSAHLDLPFKTHGAVCFENQAMFHPKKYLVALAKLIPDAGSHVFEETRATGVKEGEPCQVITEKGLLTAKNVVIATHFPFVMEGAFYNKIYPRQTYLMALRIKEKAPEGMYYGVGASPYTLRPHVHQTGEVLLIGGENHKTGHGGNIKDHYLKIYEFARKNFSVESVVYFWTSQDNVTMDRIPYIGRLTSGSKYLYLATGFQGWGMTSGTLSGMILKDLITGKKNKWSELFDSTRTSPLKPAEKFISENIEVTKDFESGGLKKADTNITSLKPAEGGIYEMNNDRTAVYKDSSGKLHSHASVCTHRGCILQWDNAEKTWDCPCHGSRFQYDGEVLYGPALKPLEKKPDSMY
jgi:glycine/D-amino acid oxidase-like deaminating enzyme/nitrite reductase/ring-hydroxylating ferredoxin subunit